MNGVTSRTPRHRHARTARQAKLTDPQHRNTRARKSPRRSGPRGLSTSSGGGIRTRDLWVMSPTSCHCSTPRCRKWTNEIPRCGPRLRRSGVRAAASPPTRSPAQYSPALAPGTTRFGMGRGGIGAALGHAHTRPPQPRPLTARSRSRSKHLLGDALWVMPVSTRGGPRTQSGIHPRP